MSDNCNIHQKEGIILVLSGPSGCGKGTIVKELLGSCGGEFALSVSATTRAPRTGEEHGKQYYFITKEEFEDRIEKGEILEYTNFCGNYYGTPKKELYDRTAKGINVILEIEIEGAMNVKRLCPEAVLIFILPPDAKTLESRLRGRGTNTEEDIQNRLARAKEEIVVAKDYDYVIVNENDGVALAAQKIREIVHAEQARISRSAEKLNSFFAK